ncbi:MAG TPA: serine/threonine-protein kinase [Ktedonobacteraceae bacterium]|jgi:serine/threonine-protein kinase|nr:serine/threonine-protein kinase [Ktedonobacteraceae bacterium]
MDASVDPNLGCMVRGYRLEKVLEKGKLTTLYRASTEELWLPPALNIMLLDIPTALSAAARVQLTERFMREARRLITLRHPSLLPFFGYGEEAGRLYLLFPPYTVNTTLARRLQRQRNWSPSEAFAVLAPLCSAFDYIHHQGLTYQFFSPANILLQENAASQITGLRIPQMLLMQGLDEEMNSKATNRHLKNVAEDYVGVPSYLAPEVVRGEPVDTRSDIYSLGIILFELLSGQTPFTGATYIDIARKHIREPLPSLHAIAPNIPVALELVVNRALHRNPDHRFATVGGLIVALSHVIDERLHMPAFLSNKQTIGEKQTPASIHEHHYVESSLRQAEAERTSGDGIDTDIDIAVSHTPPISPTSLTSSRIDEVASAGAAMHDTDALPLARFVTHNTMDKMAEHIQQLRERIQGENRKW